MLRRQFRVAEESAVVALPASTSLHGDARTVSGEYPGAVSSAAPASLDFAETRPLPEAIATIRDNVHRRLIEDLNQQRLAGLSADDARRAVREAASQVLATLPPPGVGEWRLQVLDELADEVLGFGPLEPLLRDDSVSEIMVNGP
jgi:pilus assembly protein CpaF